MNVGISSECFKTENTLMKIKSNDTKCLKKVTPVIKKLSHLLLKVFENLQKNSDKLHYKALITSVVTK